MARMFIAMVAVVALTAPLPKHVRDVIAEPVMRAGIRENMQTAWDAYNATDDPTQRVRIGQYLLAADKALLTAPEVMHRKNNYKKSAKWNRENRVDKIRRWDDPNATQAGSLVRLAAC